jgi:demethylmenaquinone methyltransferase/2-methoxy-6-polyprenyl-1,4-benzoquinol methylase
MSVSAPDGGERLPEISRVLQSKAETRAFYNKIAKVYDLLAERSEQPVRETALRMLAPRPGEAILEIGSGTGHTLVDLARAVGPRGSVWGIDLAEEMVRLARDTVRRAAVADRVGLCCGDGAALPFATASADAIFTSFTLELFDTPEIPAVLADCRRVLRPGGRLLVASLSKEPEPGPIERLYEWTHQHFPNLLDCRPIHVRRSVEGAGFRIRDVEKVRMWVGVEIVVGVR